MSLETVEPQEIWQHFAALNAIPRASKKEEQVIQFIVDFGNSLSLDTQRDEIGNVVIRKPATVGFEQKQTLVLQAHLDMVHQKNNDTVFDFDQQGIAMYVDGDWVRAKGTTLGADNGLGVACMMAVLSSTTISHPPIEALFTIDEETGMTGANGLSENLLQGKLMINLDTEDDDEITIGCAGGIDVTATGSYTTAQLQEDADFAEITIKGLKGGHSGMDIHKGLGNANKLLVRILHALDQQQLMAIQSVQGGGLRNAIPREATAFIAFHASHKAAVYETTESLIATILAEYQTLEPEIKIQISASAAQSKEVMEKTEQRVILNALLAAHDGVFRMSPSIPDLVEASNNVARVQIADGHYTILCLTRSSVESSKFNLAYTLQAVFNLIGADVELAGDYPGWAPAPEGNLVKIIQETYVRLFASEPKLSACHAGLECGLIGKKYPDMEMVSIGPTIKGAHSPEERASISSLQKFWKLLQEVLGQIN